MNKLKDKRTIKILIGNIFVRSAKSIFQIFLNIFIWKQTNDVKAIALFNIIFLSSHMLTFSSFAILVKKGYRRILNIISLLGLTITYLYIVFLGKESINHLVLIPFLIGFFNGIYRINFHNNQFELTNFKNRGNFEGIKKSLIILSQIIIPSFIGAVIGLNYFGYGYQTAYIFGALFFLLSAIIGTVKIKVSNKKKFNLIKVFKKLKKNKEILFSLFSYSLTGFSFSNSFLEVIIPIVIFTYVKNEMDLGFIISFLSIIGIIASYLYGKFVPYGKYKMTILFSGIVYIFVVIGFLSFNNLQYILLFSALIGTVALFFSIPQKVISDNVLHKIKNYKDIRSEYMVIREIFLFIGWIIAYIGLYFFDSIKVESLYYILLFLVVCIGLATYLLFNINMEKDIYK